MDGLPVKQLDCSLSTIFDSIFDNIVREDIYYSKKSSHNFPVN